MVTSTKLPAKLNAEFTADSFVVYADNAAMLPKEEADIADAFAKNSWQALYELAFDDDKNKKAESSSLIFLRRLAKAFLRELTARSDLSLLHAHIKVSPDAATVYKLVRSVPFVFGANYINADWINAAFDKLTNIFAGEIKNFDGTVAEYLSQKKAGLHIPDRVFFHLVENKDERYPFAFLATYATTDEAGVVRQMPLNYALTEYRDDKNKLTALLACLNKAAESSKLVALIVESGEMFHPLRLTVDEAYDLLKDIPGLEAAGILCRIPNWWKKRSATVKLTVKMGATEAPLLGLDTLIKMQPKLTVDGVELSNADIEEMLNSTNGLAHLKGKWIEVDKDRLQELLKK